MKETITIKFDWLKLEDYQFKILILVKMLAIDIEQTKFIGTLQDMRNWLNIGQSPKNNKKIINAMKELKASKIIDYIPNGRNYTITIIDEIKKDVFSINKKIFKSNVNTIRNYVIDKNKRILGNMLKIFMFAQDNETIITYANLGLLLNIITEKDKDQNENYKINKICNAINSLKQCKFDDTTHFERKLKSFIETTETGKKYFIPRGSLITVINEFK